MHEGDFAQALEIFDQQGAIHWSQTQNEARDALIAHYAGDSAHGELAADHILQTRDGAQIFAEGDRIQFTGNAKTQRMSSPIPRWIWYERTSVTRR